MKTKFFKKLSFVLVVAMVLSVFAPAAGAFAAAKPKLNSTKKYLHLDVDKKDEYNFNILNKGKGWKYFWESANEDVAVVNEKNGVVTATGVGTTKVTVYITDADGEEVKDLKATVVVRDNIETVKISNPVEKLAVNEEHDFNRSFVTVSGSTKKTSAITRWTVTPEGATIDDKGVFVAAKAGEYEVTATSFQSKAKHADWVEDPVKYADYALASDTIKLAVSASIVDVKQVNKTKFNVEFDSSMADTDLSATTALVYQVINGKQYNTGTEKIKSLSLDATGKTATVETYGNLYGKTVYQFVYGDLKGEFTAASNEISDIAGIVFDDFVVKTDGSSVDMREKVNAVNKEGVVILTGKDLGANLTFDYKGDYSYSWTTGYNAYISKEGHSAQIVAKYENFVFNKETNVYENVKFEDSAVATGVKILLSNTTMEYAVTTGSEPSLFDGSKWAASGFVVPATDGGYKIYTRYKNNTDNSWDNYRSGATKFKYVSTDSDKLVINGNMLYPAAQGVVTILVEDIENDNATVGAFDLSIVSARGYASVEVDKQSVSLGNYDFSSNPSDQETETIVVTNKDTLGSNLLPTSYDSVLTRVYSPTVAAGTPVVYPSVTAALKSSDPASGNYGKVEITVSAPNANKGQYQYKMNVSYNDTVKTVNIFINVLDGSVANSAKPEESVVRWTVEFDNNDVDLKKLENAENVKANVYGYNSNNARVYALSNTLYTLEVLRADNDKNITAMYNTNAAIGATGTTAQNIPVAYSYPASFATGNGLEFVDLSSYVVTAKATAANGPTTRPAGGVIAVQKFTVKDTTTLVPVLDNWSVSANSYGTVDAAIRQAFKFQINGDEISESAGVFTYKATKGGALTIVDGSAAVAEGENIRVEEVYYITNWNNSSKFVKYTFKVNQTITITK